MVDIGVFVALPHTPFTGALPLLALQVGLDAHPPLHPHVQVTLHH